MDELIARLEAATEGSRELDAVIADLMGTVRPAHEEVDFESRSVTHWPDMFPAYTTSLDAALELVPEGWKWAAWHAGTYSTAVVYRRPFTERFQANGNTYALALCIAALRARSHTAPQEK